MTRDELQSLLADIAGRAEAARRRGDFDVHAGNVRAMLETLAKVIVAVHDLTPRGQAKK